MGREQLITSEYGKILAEVQNELSATKMTLYGPQQRSGEDKRRAVKWPDYLHCFLDLVRMKLSETLVHN
jgi:hypothetical protein